MNFYLVIETKFLNRELKNKHRAISHGWSAPLARVLEQVELVAATSSTVLVSGETGKGKELVARAIYQRTNLRKRLFVTVNCAALPAIPFGD